MIIMTMLNELLRVWLSCQTSSRVINKKETKMTPMNIQEVVAEQKSRMERLVQINKDMTAAQKDLEKSQGKVNALMAEAEAIAGGFTPKASKKTRKTRKPRTSNVVKSARKAKATERTRAVSKTGETIEEIILRVLPGPDTEGIDRAGLAKLVSKEGYKTTVDDPRIVVGQVLNRLGKKKMAKTATRGMWRLTAKGEKAGAVAEEAVAEEAKTEAAA
jgi:hypothetical protein